MRDPSRWMTETRQQDKGHKALERAQSEGTEGKESRHPERKGPRRSREGTLYGKEEKSEMTHENILYSRPYITPPLNLPLYLKLPLIP